MARVTTTLSWIGLIALASCGQATSSPATTDDAGSDTPESPGGGTEGGTASAEGTWRFTTLREETLTTNGVGVRVELVRGDRPDGGRSYLLYQHALEKNAPLVIYDQPYAGIDWTGEDVDKRWAALGNGGHPDVEAPSPNGTDHVAYALQKPQEAVDANLPWAFNGFATIHAYARFYAGGTLEDDALDAAAPYFFARTRAGELDLARIGSLGMSWGGMMAIFGASRAPKDAPPRAVAAVSAPSDFVDLWAWSKTTLPAAFPRPAEVVGFYSPYWRRIVPTLGAPPSGAGSTHEGLCPNLRGKFFLPHDTWDLLVPVAQTRDLAAACPNVEPLYWPRGPIDYARAKLDHGPASSEGAFPSILAFSYAFIVSQLAPERAQKLYSVVSRPSLVLHLKLVAAAQKVGQESGAIVPRLRELADPKMVLFEAENQQQTAGAKVVAQAVNEVWKTSFDEDGIRAQLASNGLPPAP